jgi:hypothetical protein
MAPPTPPSPCISSKDWSQTVREKELGVPGWVAIGTWFRGEWQVGKTALGSIAQMSGGSTWELVAHSSWAAFPLPQPHGQKAGRLGAGQYNCRRHCNFLLSPPAGMEDSGTVSGNSGSQSSHLTKNPTGRQGRRGKEGLPHRSPNRSQELQDRS